MAKYGASKGQEGDARAEDGKIAQWLVRQEGEEPQAGHRHRVVGSAARRRQGAAEKVGEEDGEEARNENGEEVREKIDQEKIGPEKAGDEEVRREEEFKVICRSQQLIDTVIGGSSRSRRSPPPGRSVRRAAT
jgi:hypothetical protein